MKSRRVLEISKDDMQIAIMAFLADSGVVIPDVNKVRIVFNPHVSETGQPDTNSVVTVTIAG